MNAIDPVSRHPEDAHWRDALAAIRAGRSGASYWDGIFGL